jgi:hypothetical protein
MAAVVVTDILCAVITAKGDSIAFGFFATRVLRIVTHGARSITVRSKSGPADDSEKSGREGKSHRFHETSFHELLANEQVSAIAMSAGFANLQSSTERIVRIARSW